MFRINTQHRIQHLQQIKYLLFTIAALIVLTLSGGCATVGKPFPTDQVTTIKIGETTQQQIQQTFGEPWRVGVENGHRTWTYGEYIYRLLGDTETTDLVIRFDENGVVKAYNYNSTNPSANP